MAWTTPRTWVTSELVTAALLNTHLRDNLNYLVSGSSANNSDARTFTSTGFLDLDALTGGSGTIAAVAVTVTTTTVAWVSLGCATLSNSGGITILSYRVSGATTSAASDVLGARNAGTSNIGVSWHQRLSGLTAGSNTFELQARVNAGTGTLSAPFLSVMPG